VLAEAVEIMDEAGSIEFARDYARDLIVAAKEGLTEAVPPSPARELLGSMADFFVERSS
jgi:geranylgeranyl diphosphate synthase type I